MSPFLNRAELRRMGDLMAEGKTWKQAYAQILKERKK
jgi:hypothetical protein